MKKITKILSVSLLSFAFSANAQTPVLLKDVNAMPGSYTGVYTQPNNGAAIGSTYFFAGMSANTGMELWKTDGTVVGTILIKDIYPGGLSSNPANFKVVGTTVYFTAN